MERGMVLQGFWKIFTTKMNRIFCDSQRLDAEDPSGVFFFCVSFFHTVKWPKYLQTLTFPPIQLQLDS